MPLIDAHLHLQDPALAADLEGVMERARGAGVRWMVCNGTREGDWERVAELARRYEEVVPCFGLHPWYVRERSERWMKRLEGLLEAMPSAVGEIGLDRWIEPRDEAAQEQVFRAQLAVARRRGLPAMIHCLRAWGWLMEVLGSEAPLPGGMLIHAYGGPVEMIKPLAERGAYFSFAGNVFEAKRAKAQEALAAVPMDRLLLETDAPDMLPPEGYRLACVRGTEGKQHNEPANLAMIVRGAAQVRGVDEERLAEAVWGNARRFFDGLLR